MVPRFLFAPLFLSLSGPFMPAAEVDYGRQIAPLFDAYCVDCHGADDADGDFALHEFEALMKGGKAGRAVVPGDAQNSLLVKFLEGRSGKEGKNQFMPPGKRDHLKPEEVALIRAWIDHGAKPPQVMTTATHALAALPKVPVRVPPRLSVLSLATASDGRMVVAGLPGLVRLLEPGGRVVRDLRGLAGKANAVGFSPDGKHVFAAAGEAGMKGEAGQWRVADGTLVRKYEGHTDALHALAVSPEGRWLATGGYDQKIRLWDTVDGQQVRVLDGHNGAVFALAFRPDGKVLASASADRTVKLWEVSTGKRLDTFSQPLKEQTSLAFSPDGKMLAAGGADQRLRLWKVSPEAVEGSNQLLSTRFAHEGTVLSVAFDGSGRHLFSSGADRSAKIWNARTLVEEHLLDRQPEWVSAVAAVGPSHVLLGRLDGTIQQYVVATGKPVAVSRETAEGKDAARKASARVMKPEITRIFPKGVRSGGATRLRVTGKHLQSLHAFRAEQGRIHGKVISSNDAGTSAEVEVTVEGEVPRSQVAFKAVTAGGESAPVKLLVDYLPQLTSVPDAGGLPHEPVNAWGVLRHTGQVDVWPFQGRKGETILFDLAARRLDSKLTSPRLEVVDAKGTLLASNNGLDSGSDPFLAFTVPADGPYKLLVREVTLSGSEDHVYRLTAGTLPYVTGWWPLSVPPGRDSEIELVGYNLTQKKLTVTAPASGEVSLPLDGEHYRSRVSMTVAVSPLPVANERESQGEPLKLTVPMAVNGRLWTPGSPTADADDYSLHLEAGRKVVMETRAAQLGSPADTRLEVLDEKGEPVPMMRLQATKDSWITLRSEDANDPAIRLGQFDEMAIDDYMYFNGEVLKIYRLARGPDADMIFYASGGKRRAYFNTSPAGHGLDDLCYAVEPRPLGAALTPNGLPVFLLHYANDDDGERKLGRDSRLVFTAPAAGTYKVRVTDTRGWSGERMAYELVVRDLKPDFAPRLRMPAAVTVPAGGGVQFAIAVDRQDEFDGPVSVEVSGVPDGFYVSTPVVVEAGHLEAAGVIYALPGTKPGRVDFTRVKMTARATVGGAEQLKAVNGLPSITVAPPAPRSLFMEPDLAGRPAGDGKSAPERPYEITIEPGKLTSAWLRVDRRGDDALIGLDVENLPHGVIVDNIGLNGVQIRAGENEREVFLSCAPWVAEQDRLCHVVVGSARNDAVKADAAATSFPVLLKVRRKTMASTPP